MRCSPLALFACLLTSSALADTTRFCLEGAFDLGARLQGTHPQSGEFYPATWCVVSDDDTERVRFSGIGKSNPDLDGGWTVAYFPPDRVRIVNADNPPDVEFHGTDNAAEARSVRRLDPRRLTEEFNAHADRFDGMDVEIEENRLRRLSTVADLPLRGRVSVTWAWTWADPERPGFELRVDGEMMFRGTANSETLGQAAAQAVWTATPGKDPVQVPGENWPARIDMELINLTDDVYLVRGVRTGFRHLVVDTSEGLVVGDAPAGWVELHQIPPSDLVPDLGVSGLSERFIDFLKSELPGRPVAAVALTHFHDDHAGGARAFTAEGAAVYAPAPSAAFLADALNRSEMPGDRLAETSATIDVIPVVEPVTIGEGASRVEIVPLGAGPHVDASVGVWAVGRDYFFVSDIHVPNSDADAPSESRALTECWFASQVVGLLPDSVRVVNSHSGAVTPVSRLKAYLDSKTCRASKAAQSGTH